MTVNSNNLTIKKPVVITATKATPITPSWLRQPLDAPGFESFPLMISISLLGLAWVIFGYSPPPPSATSAAQKKKRS